MPRRAVSLSPEAVAASANRARDRALEQGIAAPRPPAQQPEQLEELTCPSARSDRPGTRAFAVAGGPLLEYLQHPVETSPELLEMAGA